MNFKGGKAMFKLVKTIDSFEPSNEKTKHTKERQKRLTLANQLIISESGKIIQYAICDTEHDNGLEVHVIYNNGIVFVYNMESRKLITVLIARIPQIERYNVAITKTMKQKIKSHIKQGYNEL